MPCPCSDYGQPWPGQCSIWAGNDPPDQAPLRPAPEGCSCVFCGTSLSGPCLNMTGDQLDFYNGFAYTVNVTGSNAYGSASASITFRTNASIGDFSSGALCSLNK